MNSKMDQENNNAGKIVCVKTPWESTKSIRNLSTSSTHLDLKGILELTTGFPCNTYNFYYGANLLDNGDMVLFDELPSGSVLKMVIKPELKNVLECLMKNGKIGEIYSLCLAEDEEDNDGDHKPLGNPRKKDYNIGKLFFVACVSAYEGKLNLLKELLKEMPQLLSSKTLLGRTLVHIGAVSDRPQILLEILSASVKHSTQTQPIDRFGKTPMACAKHNHAFLCERLIKHFSHHQRAGTLGAFLAQRQSNEHKSEKTISRQKKPRAKSAVPPRSQSAFSTVSSANSNIRLKKQVSFETVSSGYQTDEHRISRGTLPSQAASPSPDIATEHKSKKVKFKNRIKSAPPKMDGVLQKNDTKYRPTHDTCFERKPFMAFREVDPNELRSLSVEYIPMERKHVIGMDARNREKKVQSMLTHKDLGSDPTTPYSSLNNSLQDLTALEETGCEEEQAVKYAWHQQKGALMSTDDPRLLAQENKKQISKRFTYPKTATSKRVQSAKYYKADYHVRAEEDKYYEDIPRPRPKGAGPKYRAWKPWLLEVYKQQANQRKEEARNWEKKHQNMVAYREWLKNKQQQEADQESSSEDDDEYTEGESFESWLKKKKHVFEKMDKKRKEEQKRLDNPERKPLVDRHVTIYELCSTDGVPMKIDSPYTYMRAYQKWKRRKTKYESWKKKNSPDNKDEVSEMTTDDARAVRGELYLDGFTYNEWLGQMDREAKIKDRESKKKVQFNDYVL